MIEIFTFDNLAALCTLTALEIILGVDNIVFIAILVDKLEKAERPKARIVGLGLAMVFRILLLLTLSWIMLLTAPLFSLMGVDFSGKSLILLGGGLFLIWKATHEVHRTIEPAKNSEKVSRRKATFASIVSQILIIDLVFSLDSVITAVGMAQDLWVMITAIIIAILVMMRFARYISDFITEHPTLKMLALSFLLLVGVMLVADGLGTHVSRGYIYFAMAFSLFVEVLNMKVRAGSGT